ncbi:hypothetical protein AC578_9934 [Pseudocercospora eumusae]|uniref:Rhodopsin domain-containing protein n=1 Tax=Pseudocercospora eumusae TaxID=321146 RepID=A0A139HB10_9PEZI|nr:hypothetical protein AC578_9934 [Pseudocercospora eumusae]
MQIPPTEVLLSWPKPNYENPTTRGEALLVLMICFSILVGLAVAGRFYSRLVVKSWFGWDDGAIIVAFIFTIALNVIVVLANRKYGWNRHIWDVKPTMIQDANLAAFTAKLLFVGAATFTRISLICFYYRLVRDSGIAWFAHVLHASMAFVVGLGLAFTFVGVFLCVPVQAYWIFPPMANYHCLDEGTATLTVGIFNCCADLLTTILPIPLVWRLQMALRHRIGISLLLSLGFIVTIAGALRTYFIWQSLIGTWDTTWYSYPLWICAAIEIDIAVICACAPALKPLLHVRISRVTSKLSEKLSFKSSRGSSRSRAASRGTLTSSMGKSKSSLFGTPLRKSPADSVWEGDDEYGMLEMLRSYPEKNTVVSATATATHGEDEITPWSTAEPPGNKPVRKPTLEIMKRQSVEMSVDHTADRISVERRPDEAFGMK